MQNKQKKMFTAIAAGSMAVVMALTGTFAWQSISQRATNEAVSSTNPGARLHDDFNGTNKDVYVENFTDPNNGGLDIFARIRLDEYLEIGEGAGLKLGDTGYDDKKATSLMTGANINDKSTWETYIPGETDPAINAASAFRDYYSWTLGGQTIYMPTFNMNKDSLEADINGTLAGKGGVAYDDYHAYTDGETKTGYEIWDADVEDPSADELKNAGVDINAVIDKDTTAVTDVETNYNTNVTLNKGTDGVSGVTHTAKATESSTVITMEQWKALPEEDKIGNYWVYDTDGWAYWAAPIKPGTSTGLLLDGIALREQVSGNIYYAIEVVAQFATAGDWGTEADGTGFYKTSEGKAPTAEALALLNTVAGTTTEPETPADAAVDAIEVTATATEVKVGESLQFTATVKKDGAEVTDEANKSVTWDVEGANSTSTTITDGLLSVASDETATTLTVKATSTVETTISGSATVTVTTVTVPDEIKEIATITPGTTDTVTIDGIEWYVLEKEEDKALLLSKDILEERAFDSADNRWSTSSMRTYLNNEWLTGKAVLNQYAVGTELKTIQEHNSTAVDTTTDKVFLLSEADVFGTSGSVTVDDSHYTISGTQLTAPGGSWIAQHSGANDWWWLRSPRSGGNYVADVNNNGGANSSDYNSTSGGVRPALWVNLAS